MFGVPEPTCVATARTRNFGSVGAQKVALQDRLRGALGGHADPVKIKARREASTAKYRAQPQFAATPPLECLKMVLSNFMTEPADQHVSRALCHKEIKRTINIELPEEENTGGDDQVGVLLRKRREGRLLH